MLRFRLSRISPSTLSTYLVMLAAYSWTMPTLAETKPQSKPGSENKQTSIKALAVKPEQTIEMLEWLGSFEEDELTQLDEAMDALKKPPTSVKSAPANAPIDATYKQHKITGVHP